MVGGLAQFVQPAGSLPYLLTSIFPHGVPEIGGFFFTAAAGFLCGISIISPGRAAAPKHSGPTVAILALSSSPASS